jgi:hypothetical protein
MREPSKRAACLLFDKVVFDKVRRPANYLVTPWLEDAIDKAGYSLRPCAIKSRTCILIFCAGALIWRWLRSQAPIPCESRSINRSITCSSEPSRCCWETATSHSVCLVAVP